VIDISTKTNK